MKFCILTGLVFVGSVYAGLITTQPVGGTTTTFDTGSTCTSGASTGTDAGFSITATSDACFPYNGGFGLNDNGSWDISLIGDNSGTSVLTIDLGGLFSSVGGFMNYAEIGGNPVSSSDPFIAAIAIDGTTVLEEYDLFTDAPISTGGADDSGAFRGISRSTADIAFFEIGNSFIAMHDITLDGSVGTVPEPAAFLLTGIGIAALAMRRRLARRG